ncbi:MAG TPA: lipid A export permease/ATP-binding protein MsbA [Gammaproteobacteria bacterium]|nr:lipid A export permease/ATP-binding protein MsbA [Gammaproteobacteria bacterium]
MQGRVVYKRLLTYSRQYWPQFVLGIAGTVISALLTASFTGLIRPLLDQGFIAHNARFIRWLPLLLIGVFALRTAASFVSNYYMSWTGRTVVTKFRQDLFAHYMRLPASYLDNNTSGQLLAKLIYNVEQVSQACTNAIVTVVQETCFIAGCIVVMFLNSWRLSLIFFIVAPIIAIIARKSGKKMRHLSQNVQQSMSGVTQIAEEGLSGYRVIRTFGAESYETKRFDAMALKNRDREIKTIVTNTLATTYVQFVIALLISATVYLATAKLTHITAGTFVSIIAAMLAMLKPMKNLTSVNSTIQKGIAGADSIFAVLDEPPEPDHGTTILARSKGDVVFDKVAFTYPNHEKSVLKNISFEIKPGQTVALVGRSGSGKTTLVSLLPRFYDNYSGNILIDDFDIRNVTLKSLREQLALVSQNVVLFNDTVRNNISYGRLDGVTEEEIIHAAEASYSMEFIKELPNGLDTLVGENGVLLSGGQRQRLAIARALLKNSPILILDEATSSLDTESERHIQDALESLMKTRTTLVVAHRLSTIENADKIMVMDSGSIVEMGTHEELLALNGHYSRLHQKQFKD